MKKARRWIIGLTLATAGLVGAVAHATNYSLWVNGRGGGRAGVLEHQVGQHRRRRRRWQRTGRLRAAMAANAQ
jgi:hypothetical protein